MKRIQESEGPEKEMAKFKKGTTTLGFKFQGGIIIAVDSRSSMGELNSSESVKKVIEINDYMLGTMAGGAADCLYWEQKLAQELKTYELEYNEKMTISGASRLFSKMMYD